MRLRAPFAIGLLLLGCAGARAQFPDILPIAPVQPSSPPDPLGRATPRGTVLNFLKAMRTGDQEAAVGYLDTRLRGQAAKELAHQLFVVLDTRLPPRLNELSVLPEGSIPFPAQPELDLVGTIPNAGGDVDILLERVKRGEDRMWLFSQTTLEEIPGLYAGGSGKTVEHRLPAVLVETQIARIPLYQWLAVFIGLPLLILVLTMLNRVLRLADRSLRRMRHANADMPVRDFLPVPVRLLVLAAVIRWALSQVTLPLIARQIWSNIAALATVIACGWLVCLLIGRIEERMRRRLIRKNSAGMTSVLRLARRGAELMVVFASLLVGLHHFGVNPTAAFAGLGVGGIAVALAAQKTLENVIGGISIIFDGAVRSGDFLKVGSTAGTVEEVGLRSTRIRTLDRTLVSVPNGQLATVTLENCSVRDKFWFHHMLRLRCETTPAQIRAVLEGVSKLLVEHPLSRRDSTQVRLLSFGASSLEVEVFAYLGSRDWAHFLELQEELLLEILDIVRAAGTGLAPPAQNAYLTVISDPDAALLEAARQPGREAA
jgi:MscS family membrane protein